MRFARVLVFVLAGCGSRSSLDPAPPVCGDTTKPFPNGFACPAANVPTVIWSSRDTIGPIAIDDGAVYFVDRDDQSVRSVSKCGGAAVVLAPTKVDAFAFIVVHGGFVYWMEGTALVRVSTQGGPVERIGPLETGSDFFAVFDARVLTTTGGTLESYSLTGGDRRELATAASLSFFRVSADCSGAYFTVGDGFDVQIATVDASGRPRTLTAIHPAQDEWQQPGNLALDDRFVYWVTPIHGDLMQVAKDGSAVATLVAGGSLWHTVGSAIAVDDANVYFFEGAVKQPTKVSRVSKNGGKPSLVAITNNMTGNIVVDEKSAFWSEASTVVPLQQIVRLDK